jgi:uncharacterized protein (DUF362 family)
MCVNYKTQVSLIKGDKRYSNIIKALNLIEKDIDPNKIQDKQIIIKPNLVSSINELAVTPSETVKAVVDFINGYNPKKIIIAESTADGETGDAFQNFGYYELEGVDFVDINNDEYETIKINTLQNEFRNIRISKTVLSSDFKISVARAKTHDHVFCTLTLKNMMGCIAHIDHTWMHGAEEESHSPKDIAIKSNYILVKNLATIIEKVGFDLGIVDGFVGMEGDGPVDGTPVNLGVAAAGIDCVAVDTIMTHVMGFDPNKKGDIYLAEKKGIGVSNLQYINLVGEEIENVKMVFKPHSNYYETQLGWFQHYIDEQKL